MGLQGAPLEHTPSSQISTSTQDTQRSVPPRRSAGPKKHTGALGTGYRTVPVRGCGVGRAGPAPPGRRWRDVAPRRVRAALPGRPFTCATLPANGRARPRLFRRRVPRARGRSRFFLLSAGLRSPVPPAELSRGEPGRDRAAARRSAGPGWGGAGGSLQNRAGGLPALSSGPGSRGASGGAGVSPRPVWSGRPWLGRRAVPGGDGAEGGRRGLERALLLCLQMPPKKGGDGVKSHPIIGRFGTSLKIGIVGLPNVGYVARERGAGAGEAGRDGAPRSPGVCFCSRHSDLTQFLGEDRCLQMSVEPRDTVQVLLLSDRLTSLACTTYT